MATDGPLNNAVSMNDHSTKNGLLLLPTDCVLLPLRAGQLLISPSHALFCPIPAAHEATVRQCLKAKTPIDELPRELSEALRHHGFGGGPRQAKPPSRSVQIQLTNDCNLKCTYCCTNSGTPRQKEVDRERMFAVIDDVRERFGPGASVGLLGGEPLMVPWAVELAEYVVEKGLKLTVFTNGTLLGDDDNARRLAELMGQGATVRVSLAGASNEMCDQLSGTARFEQGVAGINNLARFGGQAAVDLMLLPEHVDDVVQHLPALRAMLPDQTKIAVGVLYLAGRELGQNLFGSRAQLEGALDRIAFEAGETIAAAETKPLADRRDGCSCALGHHLHIRSDGALFTCFKMEEQIGDLNEISFADAIDTLPSYVRPATDLAFCADCPLATLCGGGCRTENLQYTGDPEKPVCGPWRIEVLSELLAEDRVTALEWPATHLWAEAHVRGIEAPERLDPVVPSRHLIDT